MRRDSKLVEYLAFPHPDASVLLFKERSIISQSAKVDQMVRELILSSCVIKECFVDWTELPWRKHAPVTSFGANFGDGCFLGRKFPAITGHECVFTRLFVRLKEKESVIVETFDDNHDRIARHEWQMVTKRGTTIEAPK